ncbi:MAG: hypothetical protein GY946_04935 [bacterium]|nr:hypothetical protein [bacterium]
MPYFAQPIAEGSTTARTVLGDVQYGADGTEYMYALFDAGAATINTAGGQVLSWLDRDGFEMTLDESAGNDLPAGVVPVGASLTDGDYFWAQRKGPHAAVQKPAAGSDTWTDGQHAIMHATVDGEAAKASASPVMVVADIARYIGIANGVSVDGAPDTVPLQLDIST